MTSEQIDIVRSNFAQIFFKKEEAGRLFYQRLFAIAPATRPLFKGDIDNQARKLMDTLGVAISALRDMPRLEATLLDLGRRHRRYGVQPEHYQGWDKRSWIRSREAWDPPSTQKRAKLGRRFTVRSRQR